MTDSECFIALVAGCSCTAESTESLRVALRKIAAYALRRFKNHSLEPDDIAQQAFLRLWASHADVSDNPEWHLRSFVWKSIDDLRPPRPTPQSREKGISAHRPLKREALSDDDLLASIVLADSTHMIDIAEGRALLGELMAEKTGGAGTNADVAWHDLIAVSSAVCSTEAAMWIRKQVAPLRHTPLKSIDTECADHFRAPKGEVVSRAEPRSSPSVVLDGSHASLQRGAVAAEIARIRLLEELGLLANDWPEHRPTIDLLRDSSIEARVLVRETTDALEAKFHRRSQPTAGRSWREYGEVCRRYNRSDDGLSLDDLTENQLEAIFLVRHAQADEMPILADILALGADSSDTARGGAQTDASARATDSKVTIANRYAQRHRRARLEVTASLGAVIHDPSRTVATRLAIAVAGVALYPRIATRMAALAAYAYQLGLLEAENDG